MIDHLKMAALAMGALAFIGTAGIANAVSTCAASKIKAVGRKASCKLRLESREVGRGGAKNPVKVTACETKFSLAIARADTKGPDCTTTDDTVALEAKVDAFVDDVDTEISGVADPPLTASKCQAAKIAAAARKAKCKLGLWARMASNGDPLDPAKEQKCEEKFAAAFAKADLGADCGASTGDAVALETKVDAFVVDVVGEIPDTLASTTTTTTLPSCCPAARIETTSSVGTMELATIGPFPFPSNVQTVIQVGAAPGYPDCSHTGIVLPGGFSVPTACFPQFGFSVGIIAAGCESGGADGAATVWDANSTAPDPDVSTRGDTSDPDGNNCATLGTGCHTSAGGAGNDDRGNINKTRGGAPHAGGAVHTQLDIPVHVIVWADAEGVCPDADGMFDPGTDTLAGEFDVILSPTTGNTSATFTDLNGEGCTKAGLGPNSKSGSGTPATGPCCTVGQSMTMAAAAAAFTGGAPLYDLTFKTISPATISNCAAPSSSATCTVTTDPCLD